MAGTRSSARLNSSPQSAESTSGTKRKADDSSPSGAKAKRGRPSKEQKTLEETIPSNEDEAEKNGDASIEDSEVNGKGHEEDAKGGDGDAAAAGKEEEKPAAESKNALDEVKADEKDEGTTSKPTESKEEDPATNGDIKADAVEEDKKREEVMPSNVLEKGIVYFFTRGRVTVDNPDSVQDLQRSYFVLRPLPDGAKITDGAVQDVSNNRLVALPKKVWPKSGKDRFMVFVEKAKASMDTLKEEFFQGSDYSTQTTGTRHQPEVTPIGEGVYAITSTGGGQGTTHLAYMLTIPTEIGEVQNDVGLAAKGSFVLSTKNSNSSGPANATLPQTAEFSNDIIEDFRGRAWMPTEPKHLDYANAQVLLIGENFDSSDNLEPAPKDEKSEVKETPQDELEKLENEDELRVEHLKGDDTIFADLGISSKEYPKVMTTW